MEQTCQLLGPDGTLLWNLATSPFLLHYHDHLMASSHMLITSCHILMSSSHILITCSHILMVTQPLPHRAAFSSQFASHCDALHRASSLHLLPRSTQSEKNSFGDKENF